MKRRDEMSRETQGGRSLGAWLAVGLVPFVVACGASGGSDTLGMSGKAGAGGGGAAANASAGGASAVVGDGAAFVPDGIQYEIVSGGRSLTLLAATLIDDASGFYWLVRVRNDDTGVLCLPQLNAAFMDAADSENGQGEILIEGEMFQSNAGAGPCLAPGAIGMGAGAISRLGLEPAKIVRIQYQGRGYLSPQAVKLSGLSLEGVVVAGNGSGGKRVTGSVVNHGTETRAGASVYLFAIDSGSRPFDIGYAHSMTDLTAGSAWPFELTVSTPFDRYVAFPVWGEQ